MSETVVISLAESGALRSLSPERVYEFVDEARKNQLRTVPIEEFEEYQRCELRIAQLRSRWRNECAPPSRPVVMFR